MTPVHAWALRISGAIISACGVVIYAWTKDGLPSERSLFVLAAGMALLMFGVGVAERSAQGWGKLEWLGYWTGAVLIAVLAITATGVPIYFRD